MRSLLAIGCALALSGCVTTLTGIEAAGAKLCANRVTAEAALTLALRKAESITDDAKRLAAQQAIHLSLALLARCPD